MSVTDDRQTTDIRQTTDGRATTYIEREREFMFAKNLVIFGLWSTISGVYGDGLAFDSWDSYSTMDGRNR